MTRDEYDPKPVRSEAAPDDTEVGELIRKAGRRSEIPAEDLAAIRETARAAWRETVDPGSNGQRQRWRALALAASLLLALLAGWWWLPSGPVDGVQIATVELLTGRVEAVGAESGESGAGPALAAGDGLRSGITLVTDPARGGQPTRLAVRMSGGQSVRLDAGARVRFVSAARLELQSGALYVDSGPDVADSAGLEILTPLGVVREIGTQYEVRLADAAASLRVRVREGRVSIRSDGESHDASQGDDLTLGSDGSVVRDQSNPSGPEWQWVLAAAPAVEIDGQSLSVFLDWVARETGWVIRFADDELERSAGAIRLHGTIEELRPDESVRVILEGSGLDYRLEEGGILILRP